MALASRQRRLTELEQLYAQDPVRLEEESALYRVEKERAVTLKLMECFPKECRSLVVKRLARPEPRIDGLHDLKSCLANGTWEGQPVPFEVAEVYLQDPKAIPWLQCSQCQLLLPKRAGFWHNTENGAWWQSCMRYFAHCPGCQGEIVPRGEDRSWHAQSPFPLRPEPPWEFLDEPPSQPIPR
ncbi:MAG TPA: hypothetical protein PLX97_14415 [Gemmatales bacterium]|nr:hypothetical protein [Gemmatales bacterium]